MLNIYFVFFSLSSVKLLSTIVIVAMGKLAQNCLTPFEGSCFKNCRTNILLGPVFNSSVGRPMVGQAYGSQLIKQKGISGVPGQEVKHIFYFHDLYRFVWI